MLGERAIDWGNLFQTDIVLVKKENLKKKALFDWIYVPHDCACQIGIALLAPLLNPSLFYIAVSDLL
jgi:hypothetical protein